MELTPRADAEAKVKRRPKEKKQIIDAVTELAEGPGARIGRGRAAGDSQVKDVSDIVTEHNYLPRSTLVMRLLEIREDPLAHFLPTKTTPLGTFFCAAPPGLAPELSEMFMRPLQTYGPSKRRGASPEKPPSKKRRVDESVIDDDEIEQARRASVAPSIALGSEVLGRRSPGMDFNFDTTAVVDDFQMEIPEIEMGLEEIALPERARSKSVLSALSRLTTPAPEGVPLQEGEESYADVVCPIAVFDEQSAQSQSQSQSQGTDGAPSDDGKGYSRNTVKALSIIRKELQPSPDGEDEEKVMSFQRMTVKVCRLCLDSFSALMV